MGERLHKFGLRTSAMIFRLMDRGRDKRAFEAARQPPTRSGFAEFGRVRQCRSGEPMPSPINFSLADDKLYLRTDGSTSKVKRLRRNRRAVLVPCELRGKAVAATARFLPESEAKDMGVRPAPTVIVPRGQLQRHRARASRSRKIG